MSDRPLSGVRVVDITHVLAGPYCTYLLSLLGAEVIKIEQPGGELLRYQGAEDALRNAGLSAHFIPQNADKRLLTLDLSQADAQPIVHRLIERADILVENLTPGGIARLGLDETKLRSLNSRLVFASISGFGQDGPFASWPAYDHIAQAMSGLMSLIGTPDTAPLRVGPPIVDYVTGLYAAFAILGAIQNRARYGGFQRVDVAMRDCAFAVMSSTISAYYNGGRTPKPAGRIPASDSPSSGTFATPTGFLAVAASTEPQFISLCRVLDRADLTADSRFIDPDVRRRHSHELRTEIESTIGSRDAEYWEHELMEAGVPAGRVRTLPEALADSQTAARGSFRTIWSDVMERDVIVPAAAFKLNGEVPGPTRAPGRPGADSMNVLIDLGFSTEKIAELVQKRVVTLGDPR